MYFLSNSREPAHARILNILKSHNSFNYGYDDLSSPYAVYARLSINDSRLYVGATIKSVTSRELSRIRKYSQRSFAYVEAAITYWKRTDTFFELMPVIIQVFPTAIEAFTCETETILQYRSELNAPFVFMKSGIPSWKSTCKITNKSQHQHPRGRLRRKKVNPAAAVPSVLLARRPYAVPRTENGLRHLIAAMHWLVDKDRSSYAAQQILRHHLVDCNQLYKVLKIANSFEEPKRGRLRKEVREALNYKSAPVPKNAVPLKLPALAHQSFRTDVIKLIKLFRVRLSSVMIPCHGLPTSTTATSWRTVANHLHNFRNLPKSPECRCHLIQNVPDQCRFGDHVVLWGQHLADYFGADKSICICSTGEAIFPSWHTWHETVRKSCRRFLTDNCIAWSDQLNIIQDVEQFTSASWHKHRQEQKQDKWSMLQPLVNAKSEWIFHCEDHKPGRLLAFCPKHYKEVTLATFKDPKIWRVEKVKADKAVQYLRQLLPDNIRMTCVIRSINQPGAFTCSILFNLFLTPKLNVALI